MSSNSQRESRRRVECFEAGIEKLLKRYNPREYAPKIAALIFDYLDDPKYWGLFPLHHLLHSVEANCAYFRHHRDEILNDDGLIKITNWYKEHFDPYLDYQLEVEKNLALVFFALAKQQFDLQKVPNLAHFARYLLLFVEDNPLPDVNQAFIRKYGLNISDWMYISLVIFARIVGQHALIHRVDHFLDSEIDTIPKHAVQPFFDVSSLTPYEIRDRYERIRRETPPHLNIFIPSVFYDYPLIGFEDGNYLIVHPNMLLHHSSERLFDICANLEDVDFLQQFGTRFEGYVKQVIEHIPNVIQLYTEDDIQEISPGSACDYAIELPDHILLIECKSTRYSAKYLTENAIAGDNSTGKIAHGYEQLITTAQRISDGELNTLFGSNTKPVYGFCVTFGEIRFVNHPYYQSLVKQRMSERFSEQLEWFAPLTSHPQSVSIETFEMLVRLLQCTNISVKALIREKEQRNYWVDGDWHAFITNYSKGEDIDIGNWILPMLQRAAKDYFENVIGIASEGIDYFI